MYVKTNQKAAAPTVFITVNKQRVKQYGNTIYLNNGNEFELELFNPTSLKVLAKIKLNDVDLGSGIVLRPGERVFLERYLNEAKKFVFETYEVESGDADVEKAIQDNGKVEVSFHEEVIQNNIVYGNSQPSIYYYNGTGGGNFGYPSFTTSVGNSTQFKSMDISGSEVSMDAVQCNCSYTAGVPDLNIEFESNTKETGRIEKGSESDQIFEHDSTQFSHFSTWKQVWKFFLYLNKR